MAHKGIPNLVVPCTVYYYTVHCTLYNCVHVLKLTCNLAYYSHSSGKMCLYYSSIILTKIESLLCLKLCWHNLPGPTHCPLEVRAQRIHCKITTSLPKGTLLLDHDVHLRNTSEFCHGSVTSFTSKCKMVITRDGQLS